MPKKPSAARKWCKICKTWIADNRIQREQHEQAKKHKEALQALLKEISDKNQQKAQERRTLQKTETPPSKVAVVTKALLEHAARTQAKAVREEYENDMNGTVEGENRGADATRYGDYGEELLDANGYPLPASAVYGPWEAVEEKEAGTEGQDDSVNERTDENEATNAKEVAPESLLSADDKNEESVTRPTQEEKTEGLEQDAVARVEFKRRAAPRTRRVRKKARR